MKKDYKEHQQDLLELNSDGNRTRGRYGEDEAKYAKCDRCKKVIDLDNDTAICFNNKLYMCEPCVEEVKKEFYDEVRNSNTG
jgi:hypothetical protein